MDRQGQDDRDPPKDYLKSQINSLSVVNDNVKEIVPNEKYSIGFTKSGQPYHLHVHLSNNFPNEIPKFVIKPSTISHQWINASNSEIINAPGLINFTAHSDLGGVVCAIIRELERTPPPQSTSTITTTAQQSNSISPNIPFTCSIPELEHMSLEELHKLNSDDMCLNDFVEECTNVQSLASELDNLIVEVETLASDNCSKADEIKKLQDNLSKNFTAFHSIGNMYETVTRRYQEKADEFLPSHIQQLLQIGVSEADADCEIHVEQFLGGKIDVQTFLDRYMSAKKLTALRKAKEERLAHQLNALERAGNF